MVMLFKLSLLNFHRRLVCKRPITCCLLSPEIPELQAVVGSEVADKFKDDAAEAANSPNLLAVNLKMAFTALMKCDVTALHVQLKNLVQRAGRHHYSFKEHL